MILKDLRVRGLAAACALLAAAACGGGDDDAAQAAAPATSADSASAPAAAATPASPLPAPATMPAAQQPDAILDSAMTPAQAAEVAKGRPVQGPVNVEVLADYELTMPRVRQLVQGARNLALLQERRPELRDSMMIRNMDPNLLYQRLNSIPEARDAVVQVGLTPQAYATGTAALLQAIMVFEYKRQGGQEPPVEYNKENVDFIGEHMQEIMQMMSEAGRGMPAPSRQPPRP